MKISIIDSIPEDISEIGQVLRLTWLETYPNPEFDITKEDVEMVFAGDEEKHKKTMERLEGEYKDSNLHKWVAKDNDKIVGMCLARKGEDHNRIQAIYVLPNYQGQNIGRKLMETGLMWLGCGKDVYVNVASYNEKAIKFYEKFGFVETGKVVHSFGGALPSGKILPETEMVKKSNS